MDFTHCTKHAQKIISLPMNSRYLHIWIPENTDFLKITPLYTYIEARAAKTAP